MSSSQSSLPTCASTEESWCSAIQFDTVEYSWNIDDFSIKHLRGENITSPIFSAASNTKFNWYLELDTRGKYNVGVTDTLSLFLLMSAKGTGKKAFTRYAFSISCNDAEDHFCADFSYYEFSNELVHEDCHGWTDFLIKDETFSDRFLQNDTLTITFKLAFFEMNNRSIQEIFRRCISPITHFEHLSKNFVSALENRDFTDFTLLVKGKDYPVHKIILASCSDYFATMFKTDMKESGENRVEIRDMDEAVMSEMLRFIYTGKCENMDDLAYDLLAAADKYAIENLKNTCEKIIYKKLLSVDNAFDVLVLADRYNANKLKSQVIEFIVSKSSEMMNSKTLDEAMSRNPRELLIEVCKAAFSGLSKNT